MRKSVLIKNSTAFALAVASLAPHAAVAINGWQNPESVLTSVGGALGVLEFILRIVFSALMICTVLGLLWAAFKYMTAMGDPGKLSEAHKAFFWSVIALSIGLLAAGARSIITSILSGDVGGGGGGGPDM